MDPNNDKSNPSLPDPFNLVFRPKEEPCHFQPAEIFTLPRIPKWLKREGEQESLLHRRGSPQWTHLNTRILEAVQVQGRGVYEVLDQRPTSYLFSSNSPNKTSEVVPHEVLKKKRAERLLSNMLHYMDNQEDDKYWFFRIRQTGYIQKLRGDFRYNIPPTPLRPTSQPLRGHR